MTLHPILDAPGVIQFHVVGAMIALIVGPFVLFRRRRDGWHRKLGYVWTVSMALVAVSGLMIPSGAPWIGPFGPIHTLSLVTLWGIGEGLYHVYRRDFAKHRAAMQSVWFGAAGIAGVLTFLPGRLVNRAVLGGSDLLGYGVVVLGLAVLLVGWRWWIGRVV